MASTRMKALLAFSGLAVLTLMLVSYHTQRTPVPSYNPPPTRAHSCNDPYRSPGYLSIPEGPYNQTQWIPYTSSLLESPPPLAEYPPRTPPTFSAGPVEPAALRDPATPPQWMSSLIAADRSQRDTHGSGPYPALNGSLSWAWGARLLLIGDSVDRFMTEFFCAEFNETTKEPARHTTATCHIPSLNFTITHWHFAGSYTARPAWWWMSEMSIVAFEERWAQIWAPTIPSTLGSRGRPDLVMWQSGLWDQRMTWEAGEASEKLPGRQRQLVWDEVRFLMARVDKLVRSVQTAWGADVPLLYRTVTAHRESDAKDANLFEIDRLSRFVSAERGGEVFEWGRIINAFTMLYMDKTHTARGPASWLWADMMLSYLKRSIEDGWETCHAQHTAWGGR